MSIKAVALLLLAFSLSFLVAAWPVSGQGVVEASRRIVLEQGGLVFIVDSLVPSDASTPLSVGFTLDMREKLVGYYVLGAEASVEVGPARDNTFFITASPADSWRPGEPVSLVTVWKDILVPTSATEYLMVVALNPILETPPARVPVSITIPQGANFTDIQGAKFNVTSKPTVTATTVLQGLRPRGFETGRIRIGARTLTYVVVEMADAQVDLSTKLVTLFIRVRNQAENPLDTVQLHLPKNATVLSVRDGLDNLAYRVSEGRVEVFLRETISKGQRAGFELRYQDPFLATWTGNQLTVAYPLLLNATVDQYHLTLETPSGVRLISYSEEPWQLRSDFQSRTTAKFIRRNLAVTPWTVIRMGYESQAVFSMATPYIWGALLLAAVAVVGVKVGFARRRPAVELTEEVKKLVREILMLSDQISSGYEALIEAAAPEVKVPQFQTRSVIDDRLAVLRRDKDKLTEVRKRLEKMRPEVAAKATDIEQSMNDLLTTLQALVRSHEDFRSGRLSKQVYQRILDGYQKSSRSNLNDIRETASIVRELVG